jgi:hypothetical protein
VFNAATFFSAVSGGASLQFGHIDVAASDPLSRIDAWLWSADDQHIGHDQFLYSPGNPPG